VSRMLVGAVHARCPRVPERRCITYREFEFVRRLSGRLGATFFGMVEPGKQALHRGSAATSAAWPVLRSVVSLVSALRGNVG
jgi:hypothetical protein